MNAIEARDAEVKFQTLNIPKPNAHIYEVKLLGASYEPMVRTFRGPDGLNLQIRTFAPITGNSKGVNRNMIAGVTISKDEAKLLRDAIDSFINSGF